MSEWSIKKLGAMCSKIGSGATPSGGKESYIEEGISLIRSQNVGDFIFLYDGLAHIDAEQARKLNNVTIEHGDTLINITGDSVARVCSVPNNVLPARVNQHVAIIRADGVQLDSVFIKYVLLAVKEYLLTISEIGATRRAITKGMLENLDVYCPDITEQQAIAEVLSSLDDKIDLLTRQNATLEALAQTYFRQFFIEEANAEEDTTLKYYSSVQGGYAFKSSDFLEDGDVKILKIKNISMSKTDLSLVSHVSNEVVKTISAEKFLLNNGDFVIAMTGAEIGKIGMVIDDEKPVYMNQRVGRLMNIIPHGSIIAYLALLSENGQDYILNTASGSAQDNISTSQIENMPIKIISDVKLASFGKLTQPLFEKIKENSCQILTLQKLRDTLLPKLITGEVRVKGEEK